MGTIQFNSSLYICKKELVKEGYNHIDIPQTKPRSGGEVLGCTSPSLLSNSENVVFVCDGRFHLESSMIMNPSLNFYQYNPYTKEFTIEKYDTPKMHSIRYSNVEQAKHAKKFGVILGTLGRQGSTSILKQVTERLQSKNLDYFVILLSEIFPAKLQLFEDVDAWIQIACPRLSIDWGHFFKKPLLNTYEAFVAINEIQWKETYPMDYYSNEGGPWTSYYIRNQEMEKKKQERKAKRQHVAVSYEK